MWQFKIFFPQNLATLAHYFHKNPLYELHWIFLSASGENSPQKKNAGTNFCTFVLSVLTILINYYCYFLCQNLDNKHS